MISLICVTHNNCEQLLACISSIYLNSTMPYHLYIIDNNSTDDTLGLYGSKLENTTIVRNYDNLWWGGGINQGIRISKDSDYVFFLNDDIEVGKNWLENHVGMLQSDPKIGAVGPINSNSRDWQGYDRVRERLVPDLPDIADIDRNDIKKINEKIAHMSEIRVKGMLAFFCTAFRREVIDEIGYLDEEFIMGGDDDDYARRLDKAGYQLCCLLNTYVIHHGGASINKLDSYNGYREANRRRLKLKYPEYYR